MSYYYFGFVFKKPIEIYPDTGDFHKGKLYNNKKYRGFHFKKNDVLIFLKDPKELDGINYDSRLIYVILGRKRMVDKDIYSKGDKLEFTTHGMIHENLKVINKVEKPDVHWGYN